MAEENIIQAVDLEPASTEAEQANRTVDKRDPDFQQAEVSEKKDRLGIAKDAPNTTTWVLEEKRKEEIAEQSNTKKEDKPKKEEPKYPFNDADPIFAYYGNDKRTLLFFVLSQPDGPQGQPGPTDTHQIHNTKEHEPAWYWVHKIIGQEQINKNTSKEIDRVNKARKKEEVEDKDRMHKMEQEKLFQAKIAAFELDVVRNTNRREMKSKIRRAKTIMELTAYVGAIIAMENIDGEKGTN